MIKNRIRELVVFGVILVVYNILVFVIPFKRTDIFAIAYIFATLSIIAFAICFFIAFDKEKTLKSKFLSFPIFRIGFIYLIVQLSVSTIFMILTSFFMIYRWIAIVPCVLMLAAVIIKSITIDVAKEKIENIAVRQEVNTSFIRTLRVDLESLSNRVLKDSLKIKLSKLSEAVRFSDPVSNAALSEIEIKMKDVFAGIKSEINSGRDDIEPQIDELNNLLLERNKMCRISKPM